MSHALAIRGPLSDHPRAVLRRGQARVAALLIVLCAALLVGCGRGNGGAVTPSSSPALGTALDRPVPDRLSTLPLVDAQGRRTALAAYRGKAVVLLDSTTLCQETCPLDTANMHQLADLLAKAGLADRVELLEVTVDPARDMPSRMRAYQHLYGSVQPNWTFVTGSPGDLQQVWSFFGFGRSIVPEDNPPPTDWLTGQPVRYDVTHNDVVVFLDARGHERYLIAAAADAHGQVLPAALKRYLSAEGRRDYRDPAMGSWTAEQALGIVRRVLAAGSS